MVSLLDCILIVTVFSNYASNPDDLFVLMFYVPAIVLDIFLTCLTVWPRTSIFSSHQCPVLALVLPPRSIPLLALVFLP